MCKCLYTELSFYNSALHGPPSVYEQCVQFSVILKILADKEKTDGRSLLKEEVSDILLTD